MNHDTTTAPGMSRRAATVLVWLTLLLLVPLSPVLGSAASVAASLLVLVLVPFAARGGALRHALRQPALIIFLAVFVVLALCFVATARAPRDPLYAFNFIALPLAVVLSAVLGRRAAEPRPHVVLTWLCLMACLAATIVAVNDIFLRNLPLVYGFNMGPHVVSRITLVFAFTALAAIFIVQSRWRLLAYLALPAAAVVVYLSGTRGAIIALAPMALVYAAFLLTRRQDRAQVYVLAALGALTLGVLLLTSDRAASLLRLAGELLSSGGTTEGSGGERLRMLAAAWQLFWHSPLIGHGWANFAAAALSVDPSLAGTPDNRVFQFHNDLANFAVAAGSFGVLCWLALLAAPVIGALATPRDRLFTARLYVCTQLSVAYFVFGLTDITLGYDLQTMLYTFLTAIALTTLRDRQPAA